MAYSQSSNHVGESKAMGGFLERNLVVPKVLYLLGCLLFYTCHVFRPKYLLQSQGIEQKDYGLLAAFLSLVAFVAGYFWSFLADRLGNYKAILSGTMVASAAVFQLFLLTFPEKYKIQVSLLVLGGYIFFMSSLFPLQDTLVMNILTTTPGASKELYGRQWMFGTLAYAVISFAVAHIDELEPTINILTIAFALLYAVAVMLLVKNPVRPSDPKDIENKQQQQQKNKPSFSQSLKRLLSNINFILLLVLVMVNGIGRGVMTHFLEPIHRIVFETDSRITGLSVLLGSVFELLFLFFAKFFVERIGVKKMTLLGFSLMILRVVCYAFLPRNSSYAKIAPLFYDLLRGVATAIVHLSSVTWVTMLSPPECKATAMSIYIGISSGLSSFVAAMLGYAVQNIGLPENMTPSQKNAQEVSRSILLLQITACICLVTLVFFIFKFIIYDDYLRKDRDIGKRDSSSSDSASSKSTTSASTIKA